MMDATTGHAERSTLTIKVRRTPAIAVGVAIDLVALSIWLGGLLIIGAFVAPVAFHAAENAPEMAGDIAAQKALAGSIVGGSLRVYNDAAIVCGLILLSAALRLRWLGKPGRSLRLLAFSVAAALAITILQQIRMFPAMDSAQAVGDAQQFDSLHRLYVVLSQVQLAILLFVAACYAWILVRARS
jgi:hypothetical protein